MKNYVAFPYIISYKICVKNIPSAQCKVSEGGERAKRKKKVFIVEGSFIVVALLVRYFLPLLKIMRFTSFLSRPFAFPQKSGFFNLKAEPKTLNDTCTWSIRNSLKLKRVDVEESWK